MVEIAKAMRREPRILILDEATSSLGDAEVQRLFELVRTLRSHGTTVVVITHRMNEVWALADRMTIFRDGRTVGQHRIDQIDQRTAVNSWPGATCAPSSRRRGEAQPSRCSSCGTSSSAAGSDRGASHSTAARSSVSAASRGRGSATFSTGCMATGPAAARSCATGVACASGARATR
jgi:ABC-type sugar transport system ATPase subunit